MLQIAQIRTHREDIIKRLGKRGIDATTLIDEVLSVDQKRRAAQVKHDENQADANRISKEIGELFKAGKRDEAEVKRGQTTELKEQNKVLQEALTELENELRDLLYHIPNTPHDSVPAGNTEADNEEVDRHVEMPNLGENPLPHWDLASTYNLIDFELGVKISGAGFPVYINKGARLQRALINFFLDRAIRAGYVEVQPPLLINEASGIGTGQLPDKEGQMYHVQNDDQYLIPTAEVPITNMYRDVIINEGDLPIRHCGYTPCFRREAGSYGKDVRGLNRLHQFDKVELVQIAHPEASYQLLDKMVTYVKGLLHELELPYRTLRLCGGDLGFTSALTYDLEVYSAAQSRWLEVSSISNFESFQSNRLKCRYRGKDGKTHLAHTLNGSALALPRILAALLENNQTPAGIVIPKALVPYTGFGLIEKP